MRGFCTPCAIECGEVEESENEGEDVASDDGMSLSSLRRSRSDPRGDLAPDIVRYRFRRDRLVEEGILEEEKEPSPLKDLFTAAEEVEQICSGYPTQEEDEEGSEGFETYEGSESLRRQFEWACSINERKEWQPSAIHCTATAHGGRHCHLLAGHMGTCWFNIYTPPVSGGILKCHFEDVMNEVPRVCDLMEGHVDDHWMIAKGFAEHPRLNTLPLHPAPLSKEELVEKDRHLTAASKERDERLRKMREGIMRIGPM